MKSPHIRNTARIFAATTIAALCFALLAPVAVWAQDPPADGGFDFSGSEPGIEMDPMYLNEQEGNAMGSLNQVARGSGYDINSTATPVSIIGNIIGYALALLGVLFTILTIYAGFLWMTAQGNEEQIGKAKKMLTNAVIGMVIVGSAYAISSFVITQLTASV